MVDSSRPINELTGIKRPSSVLVRGLSHEELAKQIGAIPQWWTTEMYVEWAKGPRGYSSYELWEQQPGNEGMTLEQYFEWLGFVEAAQQAAIITQIGEAQTAAETAETNAEAAAAAAAASALAADASADAAAQSAQDAEDAAALISGGVLAQFAMSGMETARDNVSPNTKIVIAAGQKRSSDNTKDIVFPGPVTVDLTVVGAGGRDVATALATGQSWHLHAICKDDGTASAVASLSPTAPTLPATYTKHAYVFPVPRLGTDVAPPAGTNIPPYVQDEGDVELTKPNNEFSGQTGSAAAQLKDFYLPLGINVIGWFYFQANYNGTTTLFKARDPTHGVPTAFGGTDQAAQIRLSANELYLTEHNARVRTNTSAQIYIMVSQSGATWAAKSVGYTFRRNR
jgi:hypothetical protein